MTFGDAGTLSAKSVWSATPSHDGAGTITLTAPGGATTDMIADGAISSGEIGAYLQMRDTVLPQAQTQLDEFANQMSQALSNNTVSGTAVTFRRPSGFKVDVGSMVPGNSMQFSYTDSGNVQHTVTVALGTPAGRCRKRLRRQTRTIDDRHRFFRRHKHRGRPAQSGVRLECAILESVGHAAADPQYQRRRQRGQCDVGDLDDDVADQRQSAAASVRRRRHPITGALTATGGSQTTGLAGRITVNSALVNSPGVSSPIPRRRRRATDAAEFPAEPGEHRGVHFFRDYRDRHREFALYRLADRNI